MNNQDMRSCTSKTMSVMMCMDLVVNKEKYPDSVEALRKVCGFMAKKLGTSREDLPGATKAKLDALTSGPTSVPSNLN